MPEQLDMFKAPKARRVPRDVEAEKRDSAIAKLKKHRPALIAAAFKIAVGISKSTGEVHGPAVFAAMRRHGGELVEMMEGKDPRWMGAVFRRKGWVKVCTRALGSHKRPVQVWKWKGE